MLVGICGLGGKRVTINSADHRPSATTWSRTAQASRQRRPGRGRNFARRDVAVTGPLPDACGHCPVYCGGGQPDDIVGSFTSPPGSRCLASVARAPAESGSRPGLTGAVARFRPVGPRMREWTWLTGNLLTKAVLRTAKLLASTLATRAVGRKMLRKSSRSLPALLGSPTSWPGFGMIGRVAVAAVLEGLSGGNTTW